MIQLFNTIFLTLIRTGLMIAGVAAFFWQWIVNGDFTAGFVFILLFWLGSELFAPLPKYRIALYELMNIKK